MPTASRLEGDAVGRFQRRNGQPLIPDRDEWVVKSLCRTRNPLLYDTESIAYNSGHPQHFVSARDRCEGCPIIQQCASEALYHKDVSVVRAGIPLQDSQERNELLGLYDMLQQVADGQTSPDVPEVKQRPMKMFEEMPNLPPAGDSTHFLLDGDWWVTSKGAADLIGYSERTLCNYQNDHTLDIRPRYIRRTETGKGAPSAYYQVDEVIAAKERLDHARAERRKRKLGV